MALIVAGVLVTWHRWLPAATTAAEDDASSFSALPPLWQGPDWDARSRHRAGQLAIERLFWKHRAVYRPTLRTFVADALQVIDRGGRAYDFRVDVRKARQLGKTPFYISTSYTGKLDARRTTGYELVGVAAGLERY